MNKHVKGLIGVVAMWGILALGVYDIGILAVVAVEVLILYVSIRLYLVCGGFE